MVIIGSQSSCRGTFPLRGDESEAMFAPQTSTADSKNALPGAPTYFSYTRVISGSLDTGCGGLRRMILSTEGEGASRFFINQE